MTDLGAGSLSYTESLSLMARLREIITTVSTRDPFGYAAGSLTFLDTSARGYGINNSGQIAGYLQQGGSGPIHAAILNGNSVQDLGTLPGGDLSEGFGINDAGQVVGFSDSGTQVHEQAFLYSNGVMHGIGTLGGTYSQANAINDSGQVTGFSTLAGDAKELRIPV